MDRFVISLIVIIGGITGFVLYQIFSSEEPYCLSKDMSQVKLEFPFKLPTVLPDGYSLQGIRTAMPILEGITYFYYGTHSICSVPPLHSTFHVTQLVVTVMKERNVEGHAVYAPNGTFQKYVEIQVHPMTSLEFQQDVIKTEHKLGFNKFSKEVDVNSYKGLISFDNSGVEFLNDKDQVLYGVGGNLSMNQILAVAKSIPP